MKTFLIITVTILITALVMVIGVYFYLQHVLRTPAEPIEATEMSSPAESGDGDVQPEADATVPTVPPEGIPLSSLPLTEGQLDAIRAAQIDPDTFVITPQMQTCAAEKLGSERFAAIVGGQTPTIMESIALLPCLK